MHTKGLQDVSAKMHVMKKKILCMGFKLVQQNKWYSFYFVLPCIFWVSSHISPWIDILPAHSTLFCIEAQDIGEGQGLQKPDWPGPMPKVLPIYSSSTITDLLVIEAFFSHCLYLI